MKKLFRKNFDKELNKLLTSMIEIAYEFVNWDNNEVDKVFVYCNLEENSVSYDFFFRINNEIAKKHLINDYSNSSKYNTSLDLQKKVLEIGTADLIALQSHFESNKRDVPTQIKMWYDTRTGALNGEIKYDDFLLGTDKLPNDLMDEWIEELSLLNIN